MRQVKSSLKGVEPYRSGKRHLESGAFTGLARLASNEYPFDAEPEVLDAITGALDRINRYCDANESPLRDELALHLRVGRDEVLLGAGSGALIERAILALCEAGDEVIFPWPSYIGYRLFCATAGVEPVTIPLRGGTGNYLDAMLDRITARTSVVIVCNPNNPTGDLVELDELDRFLTALPRAVVVIVDEAYIEYSRIYPRSAVDLLRDGGHENVLVARSFSKAYGLAGLRVGYLVGPHETIEAISRACGWFQLNAVSEAAALAALEADEAYARRRRLIIDEREMMIREAHELGIEASDSEANFIWLPSQREWVQRLNDDLERAGVLARPLSGGLRISIGRPEENQRVISVLKQHTRS